MRDFNKIVQRLGTKRGKLVFKNDIYELIDPEKKYIHKDFVNKLIYKLKAAGAIISIKAGVYVVPDDIDSDLNKIDLLDKYYFRLIKKLITKEVSNNYYISGIQSLQYHMRNFEVPDKIYVVNRNIDKKIIIGNKEIIFKTISGTKNTGTKKKINLYSVLSKYTMVKVIDGIAIKCSGIELALLESSLVTDSESGVDIGLLIKVLKKYSGILDSEIFYEIGQYKYIMSFNRLKELSKTIAPEFGLLCLDIIKKNGNLFIGEANRGI